MLQISGIKIIRVYGDLIEEEEYPIPNKRKPLKTSTKDEVKTLDEGLKAIALHHVIRSEKCPFASELRDYELTFAENRKNDVKTPESEVDKYCEVRHHLTY